MEKLLGTTVNILDMFYPGDNFERFPPQLAMHLSYLIKNLLSANTSPSIKQLMKKRGAPGPHQPETKDKEAAVLYLLAVECGLIKDRSPNKTIRENYGVSDQSVRDWRKSIDISLNDFLPDACDEDRAGIILSRMEKSGERYKLCGRSNAAIAGRSD